MPALLKPVTKLEASLAVKGRPAIPILSSSLPRPARPFPYPMTDKRALDRLRPGEQYEPPGVLLEGAADTRL